MSELPIPDPKTLMSWQHHSFCIYSKTHFGFRNGFKPMRERKISSHFFLLLVEFPKSHLMPTSTLRSQPQQTPIPASQNLPGSELNALQSPQKWCDMPCLGVNPWDTASSMKSQHHAMDSAISEALLKPAERTVGPLLWEAVDPHDGWS